MSMSLLYNISIMLLCAMKYPGSRGDGLFGKSQIEDQEFVGAAFVGAVFFSSDILCFHSIPHRALRYAEFNIKNK